MVSSISSSSISHRIVVIKLLGRIPQVTSSIQHPPFLFRRARLNSSGCVTQTLLTSRSVHKFPTLSQPINRDIPSIHRANKEAIILRRFHAQIPHQLQSIGLENRLASAKICTPANALVLGAQALIEEIEVIVAEITAVEEKPAPASSFLKREAPQNLGLALSKAEVAVGLGKISHALAESVDGGVPGAVDDGCVFLAGNERGERVQGC